MYCEVWDEDGEGHYEIVDVVIADDPKQALIFYFRKHDINMRYVKFIKVSEYRWITTCLNKVWSARKRKEIP
jgi:hypothetical protein